MSNVIVAVGSGLIGQAIARRVGSGKHVVLSDLRQSNADAAAEVMGGAGFELVRNGSGPHRLRHSDMSESSPDRGLPRIGRTRG